MISNKGGEEMVGQARGEPEENSVIKDYKKENIQEQRVVNNVKCNKDDGV